MGNFVDSSEVKRIREHYNAYLRAGDWKQNDNRGRPLSGVYDATTFREVSTHYVDRLLRYIEVEEMVREVETATKGE